jgi:hypothetical protein
MNKIGKQRQQRRQKGPSPKAKTKTKTKTTKTNKTKTPKTKIMKKNPPKRSMMMIQVVSSPRQQRQRRVAAVHRGGASSDCASSVSQLPTTGQSLSWSSPDPFDPTTSLPIASGNGGITCTNMALIHSGHDGSTSSVNSSVGPYGPPMTGGGSRGKH